MTCSKSVFVGSEMQASSALTQRRGRPIPYQLTAKAYELRAPFAFVTSDALRERWATEPDARAAGVCEFCDRLAVWKVRGEWRCSWHLHGSQGRLTPDARRLATSFRPSKQGAGVPRTPVSASDGLHPSPALSAGAGGPPRLLSPKRVRRYELAPDFDVPAAADRSHFCLDCGHRLEAADYLAPVCPYCGCA